MRSSSLPRAVSITTGIGRHRAQPSAHLQPVEPGQHQVEDDEIR